MTGIKWKRMLAALCCAFIAYPPDVMEKLLALDGY